MKSGADRGDLALLLKALAFAAHKNRDQRRKDAESSPYINHPIALADVLINEGGFFFQAEDGIRHYKVTGVQTCALPIYACSCARARARSTIRRCRGVMASRA